MTWRRPLVALACLWALAACGDDAASEATPREATSQKIDPSTGLIIAPDWELVAGHCIACHSTKQFLRQRGTASTWQSILDWMQATQGLQQFEPGVEQRIVAYLAEHYGPTDTWRRAPIPAELMPKNPYSAVLRATRSR